MAQTPSPTAADPLPAEAGVEASTSNAKATAARRSGRRKTTGTVQANDAAAGLSFAEAQAALELCLAQLQATDLAVEAMADLYQRALAYADRCEAVLQSVENQVMQWDANHPDTPPLPLTP